MSNKTATKVTSSDWIKKRSLHLRSALDTIEELRKVDGVISATVENENQLSLCYDLRKIDLASLLDSHLSKKIAEQKKLLISYYCYCENVQKSWLQLPIGWQTCVQNVQVNQYLLRHNKRQDKRPQHWQNYLDNSR